MLADWLYLNGARYDHERPYVVEVSDETHSQCPSGFCYPDIDVWHEHRAVDRDSKPPAEFTSCAEGWRGRGASARSTACEPFRVGQPAGRTAEASGGRPG